MFYFFPKAMTLRVSFLLLCFFGGALLPAP
jgi:hypothetical protein